MRFNFKTIITLLIGSAFMFSSCKKLVSIDPPINSLTTAVLFSDNKQADAALAGLYSQMLTNTGTLLMTNGAMTIYGGLSSDELTDLAGPTNALDYQFESSALQKDNNPLNESYFWAPAYKVIYSANAIIEGATASVKLTDSAKKELVAESKLVRAFHYFYLTNLYGSVPLVLETNFRNTASLPGAAPAQIYQQIVQDLKDAQAILPSDYSVSAVKGERVRPNKWVATALLARVYLYQKDWVNAEAQASAIMTNSQFSLVSNLSNVFLKASPEAIWQLKQTEAVYPYGDTQEAHGFVPLLLLSTIPINDLPEYLSPDLFNILATSVIPPYYMTAQMADAFEPNDQRKKIWTGYTPIPNYGPYNGVTIYWPNKYTTIGGGATIAPTQYYMVLRLAEQYLIRAEARAEQGNTSGAIEDLDAIRTRAGLGGTEATSKAELLTAILQERRVELFAEWGHRFFDLKRTGQADAVLGAMPGKKPWSPNKLLFPIPPNEVSKDHNLQQNPGY